MNGQSEYRGGSRRGSRFFRAGSQGRSSYYDPPQYRGWEPEQGSDRPFPPHSSGSITHNVTSLQSKPYRGWCEICKVYCGSVHNLKMHKNGKKHKLRLGRHEKSWTHIVINEQRNRQMSDSLSSVAVHTEMVQEYEPTGCPSENMSSEATTHIRMVSEARLRDNTAAHGHSLKHKMTGDRGGKYMRPTDGLRRRLSKPSELNQVTSLTCGLCNDKFESQLVFDHHLTGKKHLSNLKNLTGKEARLTIDTADLSTSTHSPDGNSKYEERLEVIAGQLGKTHYTQVIVCLNCGDRGWPETLVYCNGCELYAVHRYCLDTAHVIYVEDVTWFCEDCEVKVAKPSSPLPCGTFVSVDLTKVDATEARIELENHKNVQDICVRVVLSSDGSTSLQHDRIECHKNCENDSKSKEEDDPILRDAANSKEKSGAIQNRQDAANSKEKSGFVHIPQVAINDDIELLECQAEAQPIADPIWRGRLNICNSSITVSGLVAHMSSLACSKVLEEARLFPAVLSVDMLQRSIVWPKGFQKWGPTDQNIALYFFPENERDEKAFDKLVDDIVGSEMALRAVVQNAELLIFPSTVLPTQYRRFQAKYYLWGVFRGKQNLQVTNDMVSGEDKDVAKPITCHSRSPLSTLSNSGSYVSNGQLSWASVC